MKIRKVSWVSLTVLWYLSFFYGCTSLAEWVNPEILNSVEGRTGFVVLGTFLSSFFLILSEGAEFRRYVLSQLIGDKYD